MTLSEVLAPIGLHDFCEHYVGQQYVRIEGSRGRFAGIVPWDELNGQLSRLRPNDGRIMLMKNGRGVSQDTYIYKSPSDKVQYIVGSALLTHLADGATLIVNQVDELFPQVRTLAESCEDMFHVHVHANLYAGWRTDYGFDVHWDTHDTLIVQVAGRKRWAVWRPTVLHPLDNVPRSSSTKRSEPPVWEGLLEDGDLLYMPRGWWHVATPIDQASLHVTFGIKHPTGADLLGWVIDQLRVHEQVRRDVPHWLDTSQRSTWTSSIRQLLADAVSDATIERFMPNAVNKPQTRSIVSLPEGTISSTPSIADENPLRLTSTSRLRCTLSPDGQQLSFMAAGIEWRCDAAFRPALELLNPVTPRTLADLQDTVAIDSRSHLRSFLTTLMVGGVVWAAPTSRTAPLQTT